MRYAIFDVEVTRPIDGLDLPADAAGAAILVRRKGVPIAFWMQRTKGEPHIAADELARRIAVEAGVRIVAASIGEEITTKAQTSFPALTIAICTKDRTENVERLLQSLFTHVSRLPGGTAPEILIVDNAPSDDSTRELAGRWPQARYVREPRPGLNFARNRALKDARGELLAYVDDDVVVDRYWLSGLIDAWGANRDAAAFTGQVLPMELETEAQILFELRGGFRRGFERVRYGPVLPGQRLYPCGAGNFGAGANMTFSVEALRALGGFDEALDTGSAVPGGGDLDIFYRIVRAGYPLVYEPRFLVFHQHRREMEALKRQYRRSWGLGFMCYLTKCFKSDRARRMHLVNLALWWFAHQAVDLVRQIQKRIHGDDHIPPSILVGEVWGAVIGLLGGYTRSQRRVEAIRRRFS